MPISGTIHVAGVQRSPIAGSDQPPAFRSEQPGAAPAAPPTPATPMEQDAPAAEVDVLREAAAAAAAARKAAAAERAARIREREAELRAREAKIDAVERRLRAWRDRPDLALQDLSEAGVSYEQLSQVVAQGGASPDQIAAAEAAAARREIEELRRGLADREQRERADRAAAQERQEKAAIAEFQTELRDAVEASNGAYPILAATMARGSLDSAFRVAEELYAKTGRVPTNEAVLREAERQFQEELAEIQGAASGRTRGAAPTAAAAPRGAREPEGERRARFLGQLSEILNRVK